MDSVKREALEKAPFSFFHFLHQRKETRFWLSLMLLLVIGWMAGCKKNTGAKPLPAITDSLPAPVQGSPADSMSVPAAELRGVNWAADEDNFSDGALVLSGLSIADNYATVFAKAGAILTGVEVHTGANTIRIPVNFATVTQAWWNSYNAVIDKAVSKGMYVILCCWEGLSSKDGKVDDGLQFWAMWQTIVTKYGGDPKVFFEIFNEPYGYSLTEWTAICANWLSHFPTVPRGHILISGTSYSQDITGVGADSRFNNCLLSIHDYVFFGGKDSISAAGWQDRLKKNIGSYGSRAVLTEFGVPLTGGKSYIGPVNGDSEIAYLQGLTREVKAAGMGAVYWPGIRNGDSYRLMDIDGTGADLSVSITNPSALSCLQYGWGLSQEQP